MTSQEARQQLNICESKITGTYSSLLDAARSIGSSATHTGASKTTMSTLLPLIISLYGLILCIVSHPVWGIIVIIVGIVIAYKTHKSAASVQRNIETQAGYLNNTLNSNSKI